MNVKVAVTAHTSRLPAARQLCDSLGATMFLDDGTLGEPGNTRAALRWAGSIDASHVIILQDDALPVDGFLELAQAAIAERPDDVISYYLGTGRPAQAETRAAIRQADRRASRWILLRKLYWGVAWSTPTALLPDLNAWLANDNGPTDSATGRWMTTNGINCSHVWPCIVDHADSPSLIHDRNVERKAWRVCTPAGA